MTMFHMSNDSALFQSAPGVGLLPLYEGKMVQAYDHHAASVITVVENVKRPGQPVDSTLENHLDPYHSPKPQYWIADADIIAAMPNKQRLRWFLGFKSVTSATNERTFIITLNSLMFDYVAKQKVGGVNLNFFIVNQLPVLPPSAFSESDIAFIVPRVLELVYTAWDIKAFAEDMWNESSQESGDRHASIDGRGVGNDGNGVGANLRVRLRI